jgi:hypothetical protein
VFDRLSSRTRCRARSSAAVRKLKAKAGRDMLVYGSPDLVDELH